MNARNWLPLVGLIVIGFLQGFGQGKYPFLHFKTGISQIQITCMLEVDANTIAIGTKDGINLFNTRTNTFENIDQNPNLRTGHIYDIEKDRNGKVFYSTPDGFFSLMGDSIRLDHLRPEIIPVQHFAFDGFNRLIYLSGDSKVEGIRSDGSSFTDKIASLIPKVGLIDGLFWDEPLECMIAWTRNNIIYFIQDRIDSVVLDLPDEKDGIALFIGEDDSLYIRTHTQVCRINRSIQSSMELVYDFGPRQYEHSVSLLDREGNFYFVRGRTLRKWDGETLLDFGNKHLLSSAILKSSNGTIYLGTEEGLIVYHGTKFRYWSHDDGVLNPWSVCTLPDGTVMYSGYSSGLFRLDSLSGHFLEDSSYFRIASKFGIPNAEGRSFYMGAIRTSAGRLLFPNAQLGLLSTDGKKVELAQRYDRSTNFTPFSIVEDTANRRYIIGSNKVVLLNYNGSYTTIMRDSTVFGNSYFTSITRDHTGLYWMGTRRKLATFDGETIREVKYPGEAGLAVFCDHRGNIWSSGKNGGLWFHDLEKDTVRQVLKENLKKSVNFVESVDSSYLLIGCVNGLFMLHLEEFYKTGRAFAAYFDESNGLIGNECGQNGIHQSENGLFYFVTNDAIMILDSRQLKKEMYLPKDTTSVKISQIQEANSGKPLNLIDFAANSFRYNHNKFQIQLASDPNKLIALQYKLLRLDEEGSNPPIQDAVGRRIETEDLGEGHYRLLIYPKLNGNVFVLAEQILVDFEVRSFWAFWWWLPVLAILLASSIGGFWFWRIQIRKRTKIEQERKIYALQLISLSNQASEHFLGNTLWDLVGTMYMADSREGRLTMYQIIRALDKMSSSLRNPSPFWSLKQEIDFIENFIKIEKIRYSIEVQIHLEQGIEAIYEETSIPKTIVQSLIDNAIKHGARNRGDGLGKVTATFRIAENVIEIAILDNGPGFEFSSKFPKAGTRRGNSNILETFSILNAYASTDLFSFQKTELQDADKVIGVKCMLRIPLNFKYPRL